MNAIERITQATSLVVPEVILVATVCLMFLTAPFLVNEAGKVASGLRHRWGALAMMALGVAWLVWWNSNPTSDGLGPFRADQFVWFVRGASLTMGFVLVLVLWNQIDDVHSAEAQACLLAMIAGVNLTAAANDLVGLFLALELVSIPTYVFLYLPQRDRAMREATVKYFLLSVFSAGTFLFGVSWLFGAAGTTNFAGIAAALSGTQSPGQTLMLQVSLMLLIAGLSFRITAVPFHFYAPDVFQGVTSSAAAMLSFIPKIVGFAALLRVIPLTTGALKLDGWAPTDSVQNLLGLLAVLTMFGGNLLALRQTNLHRLLAYSSVAHAGYMLVGLTLGNQGEVVGGVTALLFYLVVYGFMTIGVFALLASAGDERHPAKTITDIAGLSRSRPVVAALMAVCLFSLIGLPPTAGFLGKLNLFLAAWSEGTALGRGLAITLGFNAAISAWYYLRLISVMYLDAPVESDARPPASIPAYIAGIGCAALTVILFASPQWLWDAAIRATT